MKILACLQICTILRKFLQYHSVNVLICVNLLMLNGEFNESVAGWSDILVCTKVVFCEDHVVNV